MTYDFCNRRFEIASLYLTSVLAVIYRRRRFIHDFYVSRSIK